MLTTLALLAALPLAAGQANPLTLTGVRLTHGMLGPARAGAKVLPGDSLFVSFDVEGITVDEHGRVQYSTAIEVADRNGKPQFRQPAKPFEVVNSLGGGSLPAFAQVDIGLDQPPGEYTLTVTVTDRAANKSQSFSQKFEVLPKAFGLVRLNVSGDPDGQVPAGLLGPGQSVYVNASAVGFGRAQGKNQPNLLFEMRVLDDKGKPTLAKPFAGVVDKDVPAKAASVPAQFLLALNRPGKFTVELKATDKVTGQSVTQTFPITVQAPPR